MQNDLAEVKISAERRAGALLAKTEKSSGGRPLKTGSKKEVVLGPPTLAESGIDKKLSSRAQVFATVPESTFDQIIEDGLCGDLNP